MIAVYVRRRLTDCDNPEREEYNKACDAIIYMKARGGFRGLWMEYMGHHEPFDGAIDIANCLERYGAR